MFVLQVAHPVRFLPVRAARSPDRPLLVGGTLLSLWFGRTVRRSDAAYLLACPASKLVADGQFRFSRDPTYLSFATLQARHAAPTPSGLPC